MHIYIVFPFQDISLEAGAIIARLYSVLFEPYSKYGVAIDLYIILPNYRQGERVANYLTLLPKVTKPLSYLR